MSLLFNQTCLNERLQANCTNFKMPYHWANSDTEPRKYKRCLLKRQINYNNEKNKDTNNHWWGPMKGPKALETILVNSFSNILEQYLWER